MMLWPAVIKYDGSQTLSYIESESTWASLLKEQRFIFRAQDRLIDASGQQYVLDPENAGAIILKPTDQKVSVEALTLLIQAHIAQEGLCCIQKIIATSYAEAMEMMAGFDAE